MLECDGSWSREYLDDIPKNHEDYTLHWSATLQYIGESLSNVQMRLEDWERRRFYRNNYIPFGTHAWFRVPQKQVSPLSSRLLKLIEAVPMFSKPGVIDFGKSSGGVLDFSG